VSARSYWLAQIESWRKRDRLKELEQEAAERGDRIRNLELNVVRLRALIASPATNTDTLVRNAIADAMPALARYIDHRIRNFRRKPADPQRLKADIVKALTRREVQS